MSDQAGDRPRCPACGEGEAIPILYGLPGEEAMERAGRGEIELGGCIVAPDNPDWACRACGTRWTDSKREAGWANDASAGAPRAGESD